MRLEQLIVFLSLVHISAFADPANSTQLLKDRIKGPSVGAHQGNVFATAPNTMEAFEFGRQAGANIIETDLHISKDGVPVVYHDKNLQDKTNCSGRVSDKTFAEIKLCTLLNTKNQKIPSFEEVLIWSNGRVVINAEFKDGAAIESAVAVVQKHSAHSWVYFQAKNNREYYDRAHRLDPNIVLLYVISADEADLQWALSQHESLAIIELHEGNRKASVILAIHKAGKLASEDSWHFSTFKELFGAACDRLFELGIDIAITNRTKSCVLQKKSFKP